MTGRGADTLILTGLDETACEQTEQIYLKLKPLSRILNDILMYDHTQQTGHVYSKDQLNVELTKVR